MAVPRRLLSLTPASVAFTARAGDGYRRWRCHDRITDDTRRQIYFDAFGSHRTKLFADKVSATFRLHGRNLQESGRLQAVGALANGDIHSARIVDRSFSRLRLTGSPKRIDAAAPIRPDGPTP